MEAPADTTPSSTVEAQHRSCGGGSVTGGVNRRKPGRGPPRVRGHRAAARGGARPEAATMARAAGDLAAALRRCSGGIGSHESLGGRELEEEWRRAGHARRWAEI